MQTGPVGACWQSASATQPVHSPEDGSHTFSRLFLPQSAFTAHGTTHVGVCSCHDLGFGHTRPAGHPAGPEHAHVPCGHCARSQVVPSSECAQSPSDSQWQRPSMHREPAAAAPAQSASETHPHIRAAASHAAPRWLSAQSADV